MGRYRARLSASRSAASAEFLHGGGIANGIVAEDVEELTGRAVKAVKWHVVGVDCATTRTEDGARSADVRRRGRE